MMKTPIIYNELMYSNFSEIGYCVTKTALWSSSHISAQGNLTVSFNIGQNFYVLNQDVVF